MSETAVSDGDFYIGGSLAIDADDEIYDSFNQTITVTVTD